jgi:3-oxoadipate enol-lactonase
MYAQVNGIKMHYSVDGPLDAPWVTFVTGIANDVTMWEGQVKALAGKYRVLRYDLRGQGKSEATPGAYTIASLGQDLVALWDALKIQKTHLVGLGLGSCVAMGVAIDHPGRLISLAPCCCRAKMAPDFAVMWHKLYDTVNQNGIESIVEQTAQRWFSEDFKAANPQVLDAVRAMIRSTSKEGYLGVVSAFIGLDLENEIHRIKAPTLFIGGGEDKVGGPEGIMRDIAAKVPGARYVPVPGAAHIANLQNEAGFNAILKEFLDAQS